jgi:hypothetical protein
MNEFVRDTLCRMIQHHGRDLSENPSRCAALLGDLCPQDKRSVHVIVCALRERVPAGLIASQSVSPLANIERLARRLQQDLGLAEDAARWSVESWALALGIASPEMLKQAAPQPTTSAATSQASQQTAPAPKDATWPPRQTEPPRPAPSPAAAPPRAKAVPRAAPAVATASSTGSSTGKDLAGLLFAILLIAGGLYLFKLSTSNQVTTTTPDTESSVGFPTHDNSNSGSDATVEYGSGGVATQEPADQAIGSGQQSFQLGDPRDAKQFETFLIDELRRQIPGSNVEVEIAAPATFPEPETGGAERVIVIDD